MNVSGLEINQYFVRAIRLATTGQTLKTANIAQEVLPLGTIENGILKNPKGLTEALGKLIKNFRSPSSHWVVTLPDAAVFSTYKIFPNLPPENLKEAVDTNVASSLPGKEEDLYWGWQATKYLQTGAAGQEVLISSIKKSCLDEYLAVFLELRLVPIAIEPRSASIARVLPGKSSVLVLNFESPAQENSGVLLSMTVVVEGSSEFAREISIQNGPNMVEKVIEELKKVLNYYLTEKKDSAVSGVILDGAHVDANLASKIKEALGFEVKFSQDLFTNLKNQPYNLALLGIGTRATTDQREDRSLSLLPVGTQEAYEEKNTLGFLRGLTNIVAVTGILFILLFVATLGFFYYLNQKADLELQNLAASQSLNQDPQLAEIQKAFTNIGPKIEAEAKLEDKLTYWSPVIKQILAMVPTGVKLNQISLTAEGQSLVMAGVAQSTDALNAFKESLLVNPMTASLQIPTSNFGSGNVNFTLNLGIKKSALNK